MQFAPCSVKYFIDPLPRALATLRGIYCLYLPTSTVVYKSRAETLKMAVSNLLQDAWVVDLCFHEHELISQKASYDQVVLFGDSLFQGATDTLDGFSFQAALQNRA